MATAACKISFKIKYTSSVPVTQATVFYKIRNSPSFTEYAIPAPMPISDVTLIQLPEILTPGEYDLQVELSANGVNARQTGFFQIGKCNPLSCKAPSVNSVYLGANDQIIMDYSVDRTGLYAVQYQIATDIGFNDIVHLRVIKGIDYQPTEYIEMNDGTIKNDTELYIRARKHCSLSEVSEWSNVAMFTSGTWADPKVLYPFDDAYCVSDAFRNNDPTNIAEFKASICTKENNPLMKKVNLTTRVPQKGSFIYTRDSAPAQQGNLISFDDPAGGVSTGFNQSGIRWIRFENNNRTVIYDVDPKTGEIGDISRYTCHT